MNEMILRAAAALWADEHPDKRFQDQPAKVQQDYCGHAIAAIFALREPTQAMIEAGRPYGDRETCSLIYKAMIKAATT
jgi:hypothetical protein